ncbi:MAG: NAD(P)H-hydrate dehydratase [Bacteroidetes bacterium]|nr:NAD(P)H-hydrate dehydratase [Bacteroidota bacterium]
MEILSAQQIKDADLYTITKKKIASIDLMETAAEALKKEIVQLFLKDLTFQIVAGLGNNGGDALALARLLLADGYKVQVDVLRFGGEASEDFKINLSKLSSVDECSSVDKFHLLPGAVIIDGLFGSGLNRKVDGEWAKAIEKINESDNTVVSIDLPSGLYCDKLSEGAIVKAKYTLTFERPKLSFFFKEGAVHVGEVKILPIGLNANFIATFANENFTTELEDIKKIYKKREKFGHKGTYGHALIVAGSEGKMGAAVLATSACTRSGAGLVTAAIPARGFTILQSSVTEAMASKAGDHYLVEEVNDFDNYAAIGVGPGLGTDDATVGAVQQLMEEVKYPMVLDADALNILAMNMEFLSLLPANAILTPHPREFERLVGDFSNSFEALEKLKKFSKENFVITVLKGAHTVVCSEEGKCYFNTTGNPGMATGGTGDALSGIITGLLAQGYLPLDAARLGVYLHGLAGDIAAKENSQEGMVAGDLVKNLGKAFLQISL